MVVPDYQPRMISRLVMDSNFAFRLDLGENQK